MVSSVREFFARVDLHVLSRVIISGVTTSSSWFFFSIAGGATNDSPTEQETDELSRSGTPSGCGLGHRPCMARSQDDGYCGAEAPPLPRRPEGFGNSMDEREEVI